MSDCLFGERLDLHRCPHCNINNPNLVVRERAYTQDSEGKNSRYWKFYGCCGCGGIVVASAMKNEVTAKVKEIFPRHKDESEASTPQRVKQLLAEAIETVHAPYASIMASVAAVQSMLTEYEINHGTIYERIDLAAAKNLITDDLARWGRNLPLDTTNQRYSDNGPELPVQCDATGCLEFAQAMAMVMFTLPARIEKGIRDTASCNVQLVA